MKQALAATLLVLLLASLLACGALFVGIGFNSDNVSTTIGTVSIVHLTVPSTPSGTSTTVTIVTLIDHGFAHDFAFCGDQGHLFPGNFTVRVSFIPGSTCSTVTSVVRI